MQEKKRLGWIDMCRGITMITVVFSHTLTVDSNLRFIFLTFNMPILFIISGFLFKERGIKESIKKYFKRLLLPLYEAGIALLIYRIIRICLEHGSMADMVYWVKRTIVAMLFVSGVDTPKGFPWVHAFGMLWFLSTMFWGMIVLTLVFKCTKNEVVRCIMCLVITILGRVIGMYIWLPMNFDISLTILAYLYFGHILKNVDFSNKKIMLPVMCSFIIIWGINYSMVGKVELALRKFTIPLLSYAATIAISFILLYVSKLIYRKNIITDFLCIIGENSMTVLIIHFIDSNMIPWNIILHGNPTYKKYIITWFLLRFTFICITMYCWTKIKKVIRRK